jgi:thioredoxin reductase (NADPH)
VSACAVCDGALPHFRGKVLAVIGGGDTAIEEALYLSKFAKQVLIVHRRDELRASRIMAERAHSNPIIRFEWNSVVTEVYGDDVITGLRLKDTVTGAERDLEVGGLFVAIGHEPNTSFLQGVVDLKENGYIQTPVQWRTQTSVPGIFAAGDVMDDYYRQAVTAAGTGCMAALEAERWLAHSGAEAHATGDEQRS